jgi:hypothetical protein
VHWTMYMRAHTNVGFIVGSTVHHQSSSKRVLSTTPMAGNRGRSSIYRIAVKGVPRCMYIARRSEPRARYMRVYDDIGPDDGA